MANHITNELTAASHVLDSLTSEDRLFDFNIVIPMPEIIASVGEVAAHIEDWARIATGHLNLDWIVSSGVDPLRAFQLGNYRGAADTLHRSNVQRLLIQGPFPKDFSDEQFAKLIAMMQALRSTGFANWYDWSVEHWGTKWNAYEAKRIKPNVLRFQTAWSAPLPVVIALSNLHPTESIFLRWADEDFGSNVGDVRLFNGKITGKPAPDGCREAYDLAIELIHGGTLPDDKRRNPDGSIDYIEDEAESGG